VSPSTSSRKAKKPAPKKAAKPARRPAPAKPVHAKAAPKKAAPPAPVEKPKPKPKSPFNKRELEQFRLALHTLRSGRIGDKESREQEALRAQGQDVSVDHMADFGTDNYEQEFTLGIVEQDVETLRDIHDALTRVKDGSFGLCEECLKPVARARLKALPYARLCVDCKMKEE
jgi:RNA polymerase-binding protein DksA